MDSFSKTFDFLKRAELLLARNIPVIPVQPRLKRCTHDGWQDLATTEPRQIESWQSENPSYNTGAVAKFNGMCIFDLDSSIVYERIRAETGQDLDQLKTFRVQGKKPRPLGHYYFFHTDASRLLGNKQLKIKNRATGKEDVLYDFKAHNSYVVGPGSVHPEGPTYQIIDESPIIPIPEWLAEWACKNCGTLYEGEEPAPASASATRRPGTLAQRALTMISGRTGDYEQDKKLIGQFNYIHRHEADEAIAEYLFSIYGDKPELVARDLSRVRLHADRGETYVETTVQNARRYAIKHGLMPEGEADDLFHTYEELVNAPPLRFVVDRFLQADGINLFGALSGHGKTLLLLAVVKALLEGHKLFGLFHVTEPASRVVYLIPEAMAGPFFHRLSRVFHLDQHIKDRRLLVRTLSKGLPPKLDDPRLLRDAEGADIFLDTLARWLEGEEKSASDMKILGDLVFNLQAAGARTVNIAHHAPKGLDKLDQLTKENVLRGSGDIGAWAAVVWGLFQTDEVANKVYVKCVKPRDFEPPKPFLLEGRPHLDKSGEFKVLMEDAGPMENHRSKGGRPLDPVTEKKRNDALQLFMQGVPKAQIGKKLEVGRKVVDRWEKEFLEEGINLDQLSFEKEKTNE